MGNQSLKIMTGIMFPPMAIYYAASKMGMPSWAGSAMMAAFGGGFGAVLAAQTMLGGQPATASVPSVGSGSGVGNGSSATYGFSGIQNSTRIGSPIGTIYGIHRVGGA